MDIFEEFWLFVRKYLFSILLILAGIFCLVYASKVIAIADFAIAQYFLLASVGLFLLGFMSLFFILKTKISRAVTAILSGVFLLVSGVFIYINYKTVTDEITYRDEVKRSIKLAKQGLTDIQLLQEAHDRKYKKFAVSFDDLIKFAKYDSIRVLVEAKGDLPKVPMTVAQGRQLGLKYPDPVWTEDYALRLKIPNFIRRYAKVPVSEDLFSAEEQEKQNRVYPFDINRLTEQRTIENDSTTKTFKLLTAVIDSVNVVQIESTQPYGPQRFFIEEDAFKVGSIVEKGMKPNWKK